MTHHCTLCTCVLFAVLLQAEINDARRVQTRVYQLMMDDPNTRGNLRFCGSQPISFEASHLQDLANRPFWITEKSDGVRYLLYVERDMCYFLGRDFRVWAVRGMQFPRPSQGRQGLAPLPHEELLLDGELVEEGSGRKLVYLIYDCVAMSFNDENPGARLIRTKSLDKRIGAADAFIMKPRNKQVDKSREPFSLRLKQFFETKDLPKVQALIDNQAHGNDGVVFTSVKAPYKPFTCPDILKWKPASHNSVDFILKVARWLPVPESAVDDRIPLWGLYAQSRGDETEFWSYVSLDRQPSEEELGGLVGAVAECVWDDRWHMPRVPERRGQWYADDITTEEGGWKIIGFRRDKTRANHISVVKRIVESITNPVHYHDLMRVCAPHALPPSPPPPARGSESVTNPAGGNSRREVGEKDAGSSDRDRDHRSTGASMAGSSGSDSGVGSQSNGAGAGAGAGVSDDPYGGYDYGGYDYGDINYDDDAGAHADAPPSKKARSY